MIGSSSKVWAQATQTIKTAVEEAPKDSQLVNATIETYTFATVDPTQTTEYSGAYIANLDTKLSRVDQISAGVKIGFNQAYTKAFDGEKTPEYGEGRTYDFDDTKINLSKSWDIGSTFKSVSLLAVGTLPTSVVSQKRTLQATLGPAVALTFDFGRLTLTNTAFYRYQFYEFEMRDTGVSNSPHVAGAMLAASFKIIDKLSLNASTTYQVAQSFQDVLKASTITDCSFNIQATEKVSIALGFATEAGVLNERGNQYEYTVARQGDSQVYAGLSLGL